MRWITCQNNDIKSKYSKGIRCYEEVLVDDNTKSALCWKCTTMMLPPPEIKTPSGYPRGWKFMAEFVDKDGNVYHKGQLQDKLFGTLPPTEIKETTPKEKVKKKKVNSLDEKVMTEYKKRNIKKKSRKK